MLTLLSRDAETVLSKLRRAQSLIGRAELGRAAALLQELIEEYEAVPLKPKEVPGWGIQSIPKIVDNHSVS